MVAGTSHDADLARRKIVGDGTGHQIALQIDMCIERRHHALVASDGHVFYKV